MLNCEIYKRFSAFPMFYVVLTEEKRNEKRLKDYYSKLLFMEKESSYAMS